MTVYKDPKKFQKEANKAINKIADYMKGSKYKTNVGVIGGEERPSDDGNIDNAGIGLVHEYGSAKKGIPARSWLRMPIIEGVDRIIKAVSKKKKEIEKSVDDEDPKVLNEVLGIAAEAEIQEAFSTSGYGDWAPKKPTSKNKDKQKPLILSGEFRQSITSQVVKK